MTKIKRKNWILLAVAILVLVLVTEIVPKVVSSVTPTVTIEYGNLYIEDEVQCYALRDETVYLAGSDADVEFKVKEGRLIKVGTRVMNFEPTGDGSEAEKKTSNESSNDSAKETEGENEVNLAEQLGKRGVETTSGKAKKKGVFTTFIDGYENYFKVSSFEDITEEKAATHCANLRDVKASSYSEKEPMYKIVDQSKWHIMCWIDGGDISKYSVGDRIDVNFDGTAVTFDIEKIVEDGSKWKVLMSSNRYYKDFAKFRTTKAKLVAMDMDGILIPNKSITTKDGEVGVYVVSKTGDYQFTKIKSYGSDGEYTVCAENIYYDAEGNLVETVKGFDEILKNPDDEHGEEKEGE